MDCFVREYQGSKTVITVTNDAISGQCHSGQCEPCLGRDVDEAMNTWLSGRTWAVNDGYNQFCGSRDPCGRDASLTSCHENWQPNLEISERK